MPRVLYGVSPIGLGHATRSLVIVDELQRLGAEVKLYCGGKAAEFIRGSGLPVDDVVHDAVPRVVRGEMRAVTFWYVRSWLAQKRNVKATERLFESFAPDVVVCDEEFSGMSVAEKKGAKRAFITDELDLGFARSWPARVVEGRVERWYRRMQDSADLLIIPEAGKDQGNRRFVGPIVRRTTRTCPEVRRRYHLPGGRMVLFSMSGSGIGRELAGTILEAMKGLGVEGAFLAVSGNRGSNLGSAGVIDLGVVQDNQNLVACADLVISTAGKSTIDEAASAGTPIIALPIRYHAEQERNARDLGYGPDDIARLPSLIQEKIGERGDARPFNGEVAAAAAILSLV